MSSEKQYKYIEDKIKDAADAADYDFNEASWKKWKRCWIKRKISAGLFSGSSAHLYWGYCLQAAELFISH